MNKLEQLKKLKKIDEIESSLDEKANLQIEQNEVTRKANIDINNIEFKSSIDNLNVSKGTLIDFIQNGIFDVNTNATANLTLNNYTRDGKLLNIVSKGTNNTAIVDKVCNYTIQDGDIIEFTFFIDSVNKKKLNYIDIYMGKVNYSDIANDLKCRIFQYNFVEGWNTIKIKTQEFSTIGTSRGWGDMKHIEFRIVTFTASDIVNISIGNVITNKKGTPILLINFDDSVKSLYENGFPIMKQNGLVGTIHISNRSFNPNYLGQSSTGFMTRKMHQDMYENGWEFGNHSKTHNDLVDLESNVNYQMQYEELKYTHDFILKNGWGDRLCAFAAPNGKYNDVTINVLKKLNYKFLRSSNSGYTCVVDDETFVIHTKEYNKNFTVANMKTWIDRAIQTGDVLSIFTHGVNINNTDQWSIDVVDFREFITYVKEKVDLGLLQVMTFSELYKNVKEKKVYIPNSMRNGYQDFQTEILINSSVPNTLTKGNIYIKKGGINSDF